MSTGARNYCMEIAVLAIALSTMLTSLEVKAAVSSEDVVAMLGTSRRLGKEAVSGRRRVALLRGEPMPWINLTLRRGAFTKTVQHAVMAKLTDALMFWEKIPDSPEARKKTMG